MSAGASLNFFSDVPLYEYFSRAGYTKYFPEFQCFDFELNTPYFVNYHVGNQVTVNYTRYGVELTAPWELMRNGETVLYSAYPLVEVQHQENGLLTTHAAAVSLDGKGIMVLGKIGAGKTSTVLDLCRRFGAKLIANDLCIFGGEGGKYRIVGGTKFIHLRLESARRNLPDLTSRFPQDQGIDSWSNKIFLDHISLGIELQYDVVNLDRVFLVHVDQEQEGLVVHRQDNLVLRLMLNEKFSSYIRATNTTLLGGPNYDLLGYIPSMDRPEFFQRRSELIKHLLHNLGVVYVSGKLEEIARTIVELSHG